MAFGFAFWKKVFEYLIHYCRFETSSYHSSMLWSDHWKVIWALGSAQFCITANCPTADHWF